MEKELIADGYVVINKTYPSVSMSIEECADYLAGVIERGTEDIEGPYELNFVTHSMGGLVARCYLSRYHPPQAKRLVMIATPNRGVMKAELAAKLPLAEKVLGPALMEMAQGRDYLCGALRGRARRRVRRHRRRQGRRKRLLAAHPRRRRRDRLGPIRVSSRGVRLSAPGSYPQLHLLLRRYDPQHARVSRERLLPHAHRPARRHRLTIRRRLYPRGPGHNNEGNNKLNLLFT